MPISATRHDPTRRVTDVSLPQALLQDARALRINVSQACEQGLAAAVSDAKAKMRQSESQAPLERWNEYVEQSSVPLAEFRQF